jgi:hypothetical protein
MSSIPAATSKRTWVSHASVISALALAIGSFALGARTANIEGFGDVAFGVALACWVGLPLVLLGLVKVFRVFPNTHVALWAIGSVLLFGACYEVFFAAGGSTAGLALIFVPLYVLVGYGVAATVLLCQTKRKQ